MANKFKVGDMVRRLPQHCNASNGFDKDNGPFKVVSVKQGWGADDLELDRNSAFYNGTSKVWTSTYFELAPAAPVAKKEAYILVLEDDAGKLLPSLAPKVYKSESQAKAVAHEMASKHPGSTFLIFKAVGRSFTKQSIVEMF